MYLFILTSNLRNFHLCHAKWKLVYHKFNKGLAILQLNEALLRNRPLSWIPEEDEAFCDTPTNNARIKKVSTREAPVDERHTKKQYQLEATAAAKWENHPSSVQYRLLLCCTLVSLVHDRLAFHLGTTVGNINLPQVDVLVETLHWFLAIGKPLRSLANQNFQLEQPNRSTTDLRA